MRHGSLFSGIGGFDLAAEWMGWENVFHCEWEDFPRKILKHYWPNAISYGDIKKTDFTIHRGKIDILTGGFPCQPFSAAGKRKGTEDDRHLWPEMLRAIREIAPRYIVGENVYGLVNWSGGLVFEQVQTDLEAEGYEVAPVILPACAVNAPHRRDRIWFVAYSNDEQSSKGPRDSRWENNQQETGRIETRDNPGAAYEVRATPNADKRKRSERGMHEERPEKTKGHPSTRNARGHRRENWQNFPTQPPVCSRNDGISSRLDGITFSKWRNESIKAYGNAIVPQVAYEIFKAIEKCTKQDYQE